MSIFGSHTVLIGDPASPREMEEWARDNPDFEGVIITDVSDVSMHYDEIYSYMFKTEKAANWFKLRWL